MKKQWKRLVIAAVCSSSVFAGTYYWYKSTDLSSSSHGNEKPLAYVGKVVDDIQRRPASRLLWQLVNQGEPLYNGEAVRTSERGEVRIQFTDSDRYLDLEPESLIVIKKTEGEIALDLMEGSLFVNAKAGAADAAGAPGLVLSSANGKVDLSNASAALSKGRGSAVDVQVLEGKASLKGKDGQSKELTTGSFGALGSSGFEFDRNNLKVLTPVQSKPIAMDAEDIKEIPFQWSGFPPNTEVALWVGPTRKSVKFLTKAPLGKSDLSTKLPFGKHYWKLVASTPQGQVVGESPIYRTEVIARYAPTVVFPTSDAEIPANTTPFDMSFKWQKGEDTRSVTLEIWSDAELKQKIASKTFSTEESYTLPALKSGTYFWRMNSYYIDSDKPVLGKLQKFSVKPVAQVRVEAVKPPVVPVNVAFTMPENKPFYYVGTPQINLAWNADKVDQVSGYRVKLHGENEDPATATSIDIKENKLTTPVAKPGRYIASIEALDKEGQVLGTSISQPLEVSPLPNIAAPGFIPAQGVLQAGTDGRSQLEWTSVEGAKEYWLTVKKDGKELKRTKYTTNATALRNLLPGEYDVEISAVDTYGRLSEVSPTRKLLVPDKSGVRAPTLKKIKVN
ncbi:hypothetical protein [Bdellovibrio svalbardensis]|uniref:FecR protein domain-containing protein n=1 Tax=Bdellovibrio svalbardensis TaxID=2972972 RepID=A0ABT6DN15_9BACT|nr:hypothetical protein [Bdellovibrio svalbardensis]MDG0817892.1 hypothetical protein [Bdellovibrio svalbardensis]